MFVAGAETQSLPLPRLGLADQRRARTQYQRRALGYGLGRRRRGSRERLAERHKRGIESLAINLATACIDGHEKAFVASRNPGRQRF